MLDIQPMLIISIFPFFSQMKFYITFQKEHYYHEERMQPAGMKILNNPWRMIS